MDRKEWLELRKAGIGGSDVAAVLGLSRWKTAYDLWMDKTGRKPVDEEQTERQYFGTILEDVIANEFSRRNNVKVQRRNQMFRHRNHPELIANIDRWIVGGEILECKTADRYTAHLWGGDGAETLPEYYLVQVMHYLHVLGKQSAWLAVLIGGNEYRQYHIEYDAELAAIIEERCLAFWRNHVMADIAPEPVTADDLKKMYAVARKEKSIDAAADVAAMATTLKETKIRIKELASDAEDYENEIKKYMKDSELLIDGVSGDIIATWKNSSRAAVNVKKLQEEQPLIAEKYKTTTESRRFLVK